LLSRDLIPDKFTHRIPQTSDKVIEKCSSIEVDVLPDRNAALELMTKRHIQGVKEWKPLAKKQFFAANFQNGQGQTVKALSKITGIKESEIREDIRDYKFFVKVYTKYSATHPEFKREIIVLKTDPFWRIFKAKFEYPLKSGNRVSPKDFFKISYDTTYNTVSGLPPTLFEQITQLVFEKTIVQGKIITRDVLTDIEELLPLLQAAYDSTHSDKPKDGINQTDNGSSFENTPAAATSGPLSPPTSGNGGAESTGQEGTSGGPKPGGPPPRTFFETISWEGKLNPTNQKHQGLLLAIHELYGLSSKKCGLQKAYQAFPVATGMVLRTVYEQALRLRLLQVNRWGAYILTLNGKFPNLSSMESFINAEANKVVVFPEKELLLAYDRVIADTQRDFLNANIHYPGNISVTANSLEAIAAGGMFTVVQGIINLI
jgi:hypothetical protein